jgi:hypothetical protein
MFWDGTAWRDQAPPAAQPKPHRRLVDLLATIPILMLVPLLLSPYLSTEAAGARLSVSGPAVASGQLTVMGDGWANRITLQLTWDGSAAGMPTIRTSPKGSFTTSITVPATALPAAHILAATSAKNGRVTRSSSVQTSTSQALTSLVLASVTVTVVATSSPTDPPGTAAPTAHPTVAPTREPAPTPAPTSAPDPTAPPPDPTAPPPDPTPTPTPTPDPGPTFTFVDNFNGSTLGSVWKALYGPGDPGDRLDTDTMGNLSQVDVANGFATITAERRSTPSGRPYGGACFATYGTFAQKYGTWEARFRYPAGQGVWPSWFLIPGGQKSPYPEIDILEAYPAPPSGGGSGRSIIASTVHYAPGVNDHIVYDALHDMTTGFHVYKLEWSPGSIVFSLDGDVYGTIKGSKVPSVPMYPIFIFGLGAPGYRADATSPSVLKMDIDYIRVSAP